MYQIDLGAMARRRGPRGNFVATCEVRRTGCGSDDVPRASSSSRGFFFRT